MGMVHSTCFGLTPRLCTSLFTGTYRFYDFHYVLCCKHENEIFELGIYFDTFSEVSLAFLTCVQI